jgi:ring-1,2-phenylacetyl-CoA epoxidase subunit PaaB
MAIWEVFGRRRHEDALEHVGTLHAPDHTTALLLARETHFRHGEGVDYAVVASTDLHRLEDPTLMERHTDVSYRMQAGYSGFRDKREAARAAAPPPRPRRAPPAPRGGVGGGGPPPPPAAGQ